MTELLLVDQDAVLNTLGLLMASGQVIEIRALEATSRDARNPSVLSGYFDDPGKLADAAFSIRTAKGIYITLNPVAPALLSRAANRIRRAQRGESTADSDIVNRRWLPIDCDANRPSGISSTDAEHAAAIDTARAIREYLSSMGWPLPILADSGNGGHLLYRIDELRDDSGAIQRCLAALAARFDSDLVKIDRSVHNPARIWKLYGTWACKGDSTADRPHRMAKILEAPEKLEVV